MSTQFQTFVLRVNYHRGVVPANSGTNGVFQIMITGHGNLFAGWDGVLVRGVDTCGYVYAFIFGCAQKLFQQETCAINAFVFHH